MIKHNNYAIFITAILCLLLAIFGKSSNAEQIDFLQDVAPIFERRCLRCHNDQTRRGGLSLQSAQTLGKGSDSGKVIVPGDPQSSYLLDLVKLSDGTAEMPKEDTPLEMSEVAIIRRWIKEGASWPAKIVLKPPLLWSLKSIQRPEVPSDIHSDSRFTIRNPIDAFVADKHQKAKLKPAPQANRRTLIRRLYLDIIGLPPSPAAVESFVTDQDPLAYERLVDKVLASSHFGERWGRFWLDLARYADSDGYLGDNLRPHAWVYREWVIDAINEDMPYDQFTIEQLAGDLLAKPTLDQKIATGFHRNTLRNTEAGVDLELYRSKEIVDRVNTTGMVWLGLTLGCAECHNHKHDPITQKEFYKLYAFFNNANEVSVPVTKTWEIAEYEQAKRQWQPVYDQLIADLESYEIEGLSVEQKEEITKILSEYKKSTDLKKIETFYQNKILGWNELLLKLKEHLNKKPVSPSTRAQVFSERRKDRRETFVHIRGVYNRPGEKVSPGAPAILPDLQARSSVPDRLDLARWLFHDNNPLTARVAVNRIWQQLFGQGLVTTPNDFGNKGAKPSHQLLLDWLATEYKRLGWSRKSIIRLIVNSSTYRLSSASNAIPNSQDRNNHLLWRQNSYRVDAEIVRDMHLTVSGLLDRTIGRRGIRPPLPEFITEVGRSVKWPVSEGSARYRRGMYILFKRTVPYPMLLTFDAPDSTVSCSRRERSNTPLQALTLLNDPVFYECAQALGQQMIQQHPNNAPAAIREMFLHCLSRPATKQEQKYLITAYSDLFKLAKKDKKLTKQSKDSKLYAMIQLARIIMNLDEFITRD